MSKANSPGSATGKKDRLVVPDRKEVDDGFKWRTEDIFPSDAEWEQAFGEAKAGLADMEGFKGRLHTSAEILLEALRLYDDLSIQLEQLFAYASLNKDTDTRVTRYQDLYNRIYTLTVEFGTKASYLTPEILSIPEEKIRAFLDGLEDLALYRHHLEDILRLRDHVLSEREEALIASAGNVFRAPRDVFNMLTNADITFPRIEDEAGKELETSNALYYLHRGSRHRNVRKANEEAYHGTYRKYRNTLAALMRGNVFKAIFSARARHYGSTIEAALDEANIPEAVYRNLIRTVNENLAPLHRYTALRKEILGLDEVRGYDLYNSLYPDAKMELTFDEAKALLAAGLKPLGSDYMKTLLAGMENGWIDVYENGGKLSGAYSSGVYGVHPFVLMNYHDRLDDALTLAHELGHSMHSFYSQKHQPKVYADYTIFNAEIASTTNEALVMQHLLQVTDSREQRRYLLDFYLDGIRNTFYRQTLFAEFELEIHRRVEQDESLTADLMDEIFGGLMEKYYGPAFVLDEYKAAEWSRIPHFYRPFYVYTYATGFSAAIAFSTGILEQGAEARDLYLDRFLSTGSSDYSTELIKHAGVDLTSSDPILATTRLFNSLVELLERDL